MSSIVLVLSLVSLLSVVSCYNMVILPRLISKALVSATVPLMITTQPISSSPSSSLSSSSSFMTAAATATATATASTYVGDYNDPFHVGCKRQITVDNGRIKIQGSDSKDGSNEWVSPSPSSSPSLSFYTYK